jgi:hypothetical protein
MISVISPHSRPLFHVFDTQFTGNEFGEEGIAKHR